MASANKFQAFVQDLGRKVHNLNADALKYLLTNTAPVATNAVYADISGTELANGNGYTTGGKFDGSPSYSQSSGTASLTASSTTVWTASGSMGPFRYVVLYNTTPTSPLKPLILWWDYGSSITLNSGETFTVDNSGGILTIA